MWHLELYILHYVLEQFCWQITLLKNNNNKVLRQLQSDWAFVFNYSLIVYVCSIHCLSHAVPDV